MRKATKILCMILFIIAIMFITTNVQAASANISASKTTATVGEEVNIIVKYTAASWELTASGNGISTTKYVDVTDDAENATTTKTIKLNTTSAGTKEIKLVGTVSDGTTGETTKINTSVKVTVKEKQTTTQQTTTTQEQPKKEETKKEEVKKGTIDTFYINGIKVKQFLNVTNKDSVSIKVNTSTKEGATVYNSLTKKSYTLKSGESKNIQILEGTNTLTITLETGHKETRKIYSQKEEVVEPNVIEEKEEEKVEKVLLKSLVVKAVKSEEEKIELSLTPEFSSEVYEYNALLDEVLTDVTNLEIEAIATNDDFTVEIAGNEDLKVGHNTIIITVKSKDGETVTTYKILVAKLAKIIPVVAEPTVEVEQEVVKPLWNRTQQILITVFTSIITMMGIAYAIIEYRYKKEPEIKIPYSGLTLEEEMNKEVEGSLEDNIPFAKVAFEKENTDKIDVLKDEKEEVEEEKVKEKPRRGKHF